MKKAVSFASGVLMLGFLLGACSSAEKRCAEIDALDLQLVQVDGSVKSQLEAASKSEIGPAREQRLQELIDLSRTVKMTRMLGALVGMQPNPSQGDVEDLRHRVLALEQKLEHQ